MTTALRRTRPATTASRARQQPSRAYVYVYAAVTGRPAARTLARLPVVPQGQNARVVPLTRSVSLVIADVPAEGYRPEVLEPRLGEPDWVSTIAAAHHTAAEVLSRTHGVLPFRLFTLFSSEARMLTRVRRSAAAIASALERLEGRQEWVLRIGAPDPSRRAKDGATEHPVTGTGFLQKKAAGKRARQERASRVSAGTAALVAVLDAVADQSVARPIPAGTNLVLDAAFLVPTRKAAAFRRTLTRAAQTLLDEGCKVSLTGPWPPYSFSSLA